MPDDIRFFPCIGFADAAITVLAQAQAADPISLALQVYRSLERDFLAEDSLHPSSTGSIDINTIAGTMHCTVADGVVTPAAFTPAAG
jgi:hypothetical protein